MRQVRSQTKPPTIAPGKTRRERILRDHPDMHCVIVELEHTNNPHGYISPYEDLVDAGYVQLGGKEYTGKERLIVMGIPHEEFAKTQAASDAAALETIKPRDLKGQNEWETFKKGGPLSHSDLAKLAAPTEKEPLEGMMAHRAPEEGA